MTELSIGGRSFPILPGQSILEVLLANGVDLDHACGGVCACSTCHVRVKKGLDALSEPTEDELDQLDEARGVELDSRLACQARLARAEQPEIAIEVPKWNVNLVSEGS
ncbi:MAG: ISC system 2Fe-2S type ferredoxin [Planctomycetota bacterium]